MSGLIFDEKTLYDGNIFKFEDRLQTHVNKYIEGGAILTIYFSQDEVNSTVDRGMKNIDQLFGNHSPLRFHQINDLPMYGMGQANPENSDELQVEDIELEGSLQILPCTIVPKPFDFFIIKHLKMNAIFEVKNVVYDSMKVNGYYKIDYRLHSTSKETLANMQKQVLDVSNTDLNMIGTKVNPIIKEEDFILRSKIEKMCNNMIKSYIALFYNDRHNCFLYKNLERQELWFDVCAHQFMREYAIMNYHNSAKCITLTNKLDDSNFLLNYNNCIFNWIEMHSPIRMLQKFNYTLQSSNHYPYSSFYRWNEEVQIMMPLDVNTKMTYFESFSYFDETQFISLLEDKQEPFYDYDKLIWKFIRNKELTYQDVPLTLGDSLFKSSKHLNVYLYTPIIIYILRFILKLY